MWVNETVEVSLSSLNVQMGIAQEVKNASYENAGDF